jgi:hypothetical protein
MVHIELTPRQAEELKNHYILELERLQQRSAEIMGILSKLAHEPISIERSPDTIAPRPEIKVNEPKPVVQPEPKIKRRGRPTNNPDWRNYIPQLLKEQNKPLTGDQILKSYQRQYNIDLSGSKSAKLLLTQTLQRLRVKHNLITNIKRKGHRGHLYTLVNPAEAKAEKTVPAEPATIIESDKKSPANTKYNWPQFITETLTKSKRVLSLKDIVNHAMVHYDIEPTDKKATYGKISPVLSQLSKSKDKIRPVRKDGLPLKYYGLTQWFNDKGELIVLYK